MARIVIIVIKLMRSLNYFSGTHYLCRSNEALVRYAVFIRTIDKYWKTLNYFFITCIVYLTLKVYCNNKIRFQF